MARMTAVGVDSPQMEAFRELMRAQDALSRVLDRELMDERGLSLSEYVVLLTLRYAPQGSVPVGALCAEVHLTRSGVTRLVDRMEAAGMVERIAEPGDRRTVRAAITKHGRDELRKAWPVHRRGIDQYFSANLSDAEAETLRDLLRRFVSRPGATHHASSATAVDQPRGGQETAMDPSRPNAADPDELGSSRSTTARPSARPR